MENYKNPKGWEINPMSGNKEAAIRLPSVASWAVIKEEESEMPKIGDKNILTQNVLRKKKGKKSKAKRKTKKKDCGCK
jgi:hypothetical protein